MSPARLLVFLCFTAATLAAQSAKDVTGIIANIAQSAVSATSWKIEGLIVYPANQPDGIAGAVPFTLLMRAPNQSYFEHLDGPSPSLIVCDGASAWVCSPPFRRYAKQAVAGNSLCAPIVGEWQMLATKLESPALAGRCGSDPTNSSQEFQLITGSTKPESTTATASTILRTMCVDPDRSLVLWEKAQMGRETRIYVYSRVDRNAQISSDRFVFKPPLGAIQTEVDLPVLHPLGARGTAQRPGIVMPRIVSKKEPKYDNDSRNQRVQGTVTIWVIIDARGIPSAMLVFRSLNRKLDEAAMKAVRQWRFSPGTLNGQPIDVFATIEVNFRLR